MSSMLSNRINIMSNDVLFMSCNYLGLDDFLDNLSGGGYYDFLVSSRNDYLLKGIDIGGSIFARYDSTSGDICLIIFMYKIGYGGLEEFKINHREYSCYDFVSLGRIKRSINNKKNVYAY